MKYISGIIVALFLVLPLSVYSQQSGQGKTDQPAKASSQPAPATNQPAPQKVIQPAPATSQPKPAANQPAPAKASQPAPAKNGTPAEAQKEKPAFFTKINGDCMLRPKAGPEAGKWVRVAKPGQKISSGDDILVRTGDVEIELYSETTVKLKAECMVTYFQSRENIRPLAFIRPDYPTTKIKVTKGTIFAKVSPFEISKHFVVFDTPSGVAGVRGTVFSLGVDADGKVTIHTDDGTVVVADGQGNFNVSIGAGVEAKIKINADGSFSIAVPQGSATAQSPNATFNISAGGSIDLKQNDNGTTNAKVVSGSVAVQVGNIQANLGENQAVNLGSDNGGTTIESTGTGTVHATVNGNNVVSMNNGEKILVTPGEKGTTIEGQSGAPTVTGSDGQVHDLKDGGKVTVENGSVNTGGEKCTPSVSPYKTCP